MTKGSGLSPSTTGHVKPGGNLGGPSSKAKYLSVTDSVQYREGKVKSTPMRGVKEYLNPHVYKLWEGYFNARPRTFCIMGWRLNFCGKVKPSEVEPKGNRVLKGRIVAGIRPEAGRSIHVQDEAEVKLRGGPNP